MPTAKNMPHIRNARELRTAAADQRRVRVRGSVTHTGDGYSGTYRNAWLRIETAGTSVRVTASASSALGSAFRETCDNGPNSGSLEFGSAAKKGLPLLPKRLTSASQHANRGTLDVSTLPSIVKGRLSQVGDAVVGIYFELVCREVWSAS